MAGVARNAAGGGVADGDATGGGAVGGGATSGGAAGGSAGARMMRLVLDTNVWLDWLVFEEPSLAPLRAAHEAGRVEIVMDDACEAELVRVLAYDLGKHTIGAEAQARCIERCRSVARKVEVAVAEVAPTSAIASATSTTAATAMSAATATTPATASMPAAAIANLPRCSDPHDQKFLELALAAKADFLVTKDQALLDLARRKLLFRIVAPQSLGAL